MSDLNDIQSGRVLVNWKVTSLVIVAFYLVFGHFIGADLLFSAAMGVLTVAVWLGLELYRWKPGASVEED